VAAPSMRHGHDLIGARLRTGKKRRSEASKVETNMKEFQRIFPTCNLLVVLHEGGERKEHTAFAV